MIEDKIAFRSSPDVGDGRFESQEYSRAQQPIHKSEFVGRDDEHEAGDAVPRVRAREGLLAVDRTKQRAICAIELEGEIRDIGAVTARLRRVKQNADLARGGDAQ